MYWYWLGRTDILVLIGENGCIGTDWGKRMYWYWLGRTDILVLIGENGYIGTDWGERMYWYWLGKTDVLVLIEENGCIVLIGENGFISTDWGERMYWYWLGKTDVLVLIGENGCIQTSTCPTARVHITNTTWTALGLNPGPHNEREQAMAHGRRTALEAGRSRVGVFGIFHCHNPSGRTMTLESTHPLTNEYQEYLVEGKGGRCVRLITFMYRLSGNLEASTFWNPRGLPRPFQGLLCLFFTFTMKGRRWTSWSIAWGLSVDLISCKDSDSILYCVKCGEFFN
jgi:hypothetical protein